MTSGRIKWIVSLGLFLVLAAAGLGPFHTPLGVEAVDVGALVLAFLIPSRWIESPGDVWRRWRRVVGLILVGTVAWDAGTAAVMVKRDFLMGWPVVYGSSLVFFSGLLMLHGMLVAAWTKRVDPARGGGSLVGPGNAQ